MPDRSAAVLKRMHALLEDSHHWTRGALARSMLGQSVVPLSDLACCWSISGALARSLYDLLGPRCAECDWRRAYDAALLVIWRALPTDHPRTARHGLDVDGFNDYPATTHASVLQLLDRALADLATTAGIEAPR
jgi:hypothetical protein